MWHSEIMNFSAFQACQQLYAFHRYTYYYFYDYNRHIYALVDGYVMTQQAGIEKWIITIRKNRLRREINAFTYQHEQHTLTRTWH